MAVAAVVALEVVDVEVGVLEPLDPSLQAVGDQDVVEGLETSREGEAVALLLRRLASGRALTCTPLRWRTCIRPSSGKDIAVFPFLTFLLQTAVR